MPEPAAPATEDGSAGELFVGEWVRTLDDRHRVSLPSEWADLLAQQEAQCTLAKERPGCVSLWPSRQWQRWLSEGMELIRSKVRTGRLDRRTEQLQMLGRLLSTRHHATPLAGRARIAIPESFREFLGVEPGGRLLIVGAAVCVELWHPEAWAVHIGQHMPGFRELFDELAG